MRHGNRAREAQGLGEEEGLSFERRVEKYLEYSGWLYSPTNTGWFSPKGVGFFSWRDALGWQLKWEWEETGDIERAAEILERSK